MTLPRLLLMCFATGLGFTPAAVGQSPATYRPLVSWGDPSLASLSRWDAELQGRLERVAPVRADARPQLAGLRPRSVELLEDGLLRKHPKLLRNSPKLARHMLLRRAGNNGVPQLRGYMAEALFLDKNPEWGYVGKPNATQHDVYRLVRRDGRLVPENGQVKFHDSGSPSQYARDMVKDYRANRFLIPDDHVEATRAYLRQAGRYRDVNRVQPIGVTSSKIRADVSQACRFAARAGYTTYTSLGASLVLAATPTLYEWAVGDLPGNVGMYKAARSLSILGAGVGADLALRQLGRGALRGTMRGNVIMGGALAIAETTWLIYEYGWSRAFSLPEFYERVVGGVGSLGLGLMVGSYATMLAVETGPWAPVIGVGAATIAGTVGYFGGAAAARTMIELISPEMLRRQEREWLRSIRSSLDRLVEFPANEPRLDRK